MQILNAAAATSDQMCCKALFGYLITYPFSFFRAKMQNMGCAARGRLLNATQASRARFVRGAPLFSYLSEFEGEQSYGVVVEVASFAKKSRH